LILSGMGGMGKTQLMLRYCYLHRTTYDFIFWLDVDNWSTANNSFYKLAIELGMDEEGTKGKDAEKKVIGWIHSWLRERTKWLLLLNNCDGDDMDKRVFELMPRVGGNIILTTRLHIPSSKATVIHVDKMKEEEALLLLLDISSLNSIDKKGEIFACAQKIVAELDCMPLAVNLARAYIKRTRITFEDYLSRFKDRKKRGRLLNHNKKDDSNQYEYTVETDSITDFSVIHRLGVW